MAQKTSVTNEANCKLPTKESNQPFNTVQVNQVKMQ